MSFVEKAKKFLGDKAYYYGPKIKDAASNASSYLQERGHELMESPAQERREHTRGRIKRISGTKTGGYSEVKYERPESHWKMNKEDRRLEDMYDPLMNESVTPRKHVRARAPRQSQPPGYDGSMDMFGGGGMGGNMNSDMFGVGDFGREREPPMQAPRRKKKTKHRAGPRAEVEHSLMESDYVPPSMRHMF
jgi:hypothetical protein